MAGEELEHDMPFEIALDEAAGGKYLGDPKVLARLLGGAVADAMKKLGEADEVARRAALRNAARPAAAALMGWDKAYKPVPGWNKPGGIDAYTAAKLGNTERTPARRMELTVLSMISEALDVKSKAEMEKLVNRYVRLCLGIDAA